MKKKKHAEELVSCVLEALCQGTTVQPLVPRQCESKTKLKCTISVPRKSSNLQIPNSKLAQLEVKFRSICKVRQCNA